MKTSVAWKLHLAYLTAIPSLKVVLKENRVFEQVILLVVLIQKQGNANFRFRAAKSA